MADSKAEPMKYVNVTVNKMSVDEQVNGAADKLETVDAGVGSEIINISDATTEAPGIAIHIRAERLSQKIQNRGPLKEP